MIGGNDPRVPKAANGPLQQHSISQHSLAIEAKHNLQVHSLTTKVEHSSPLHALATEEHIFPQHSLTTATEHNTQEQKSTEEPAGCAFRAFTPVKCLAYLSDGSCHEFCFDTGTGVSLAKRDAIMRYYPSLSPLVMAGGNRLCAQGVGKGEVRSRDFIRLPLTMRDRTGETVVVTGEVHLVDDLPCDLLIGTDIMKPNGIYVKWGNPDVAVIGKHEVLVKATVLDQTTPVRTVNIVDNAPPQLIRQKVTRAKVRKTVTVYAKDSFTLEAGMGQNVPIRHRALPRDKSYLFTPKAKVNLALGTMVTGINAVVGDDPQAIPMANFGKTAVKIWAGQPIGRLSTLDPSAKPTEVKDVCFAEVFAGKYKVEPDLPYMVQFPAEPPTSEADVSDYWGPDYQSRMRQVIQDHPRLFRDELGKFNDGIEMPIPFRNESDVGGLKQQPYNLSMRDRKAMDEVLDPLVQQGRVQKVPLGVPSAASSPAFVVWKNGKPRVVVDLRKINTRLYPDAYPLPKQDTILEALGGSTVFTSLDMTKSFFQQGTKSSDWWKTTFVTPHRGQEWLTVSTMGLANTPGFFQHRMELLLSDFLWQFVLVYVDDIIIYSPTIDDHLTHVDQILTLLEDSGVTLSLGKCHFAYPSIKALGHHVSRLGLSTLEDKVEVIRSLEFPRTLRLLEIGLGFFGYYRNFVDHYAATVRPLNKLKTRGFRGSPNKGKARRRFADKIQTDAIGQESPPDLADLVQDNETNEPSLNPTAECRQAWETLKEQLCNAPTRAYPDFTRPFKMYVDGSKERGYGVALHQVGADGVERPILFLSRDLSPAENRYWATELEAGALVWALTKLPQYFDSGDFTVVTDHMALKSALQSKATGRRSARLNEWALFLSTFTPRMTIVHRPGVAHANADGLSRLPVKADSCPVSVTVDPTEEGEQTAAILEPDKEFLDAVAEALPKDAHFKRILRILETQVALTADEESGPNTVYQSYRIDPEKHLLYMVSKDGPDRLCIPATLVKDMLKYAHDTHAHGGTHRTIDRLRSAVFFPRMRKAVQSYVDGCPACQLSKPSRKLPYGQLQPVETGDLPLTDVAIDFIVGLPMTPSGYNCLMTVTDKFSKFIRLVPGTEDMTAEQWADAYFDSVYRTWGLPARIISDRDPKFTSAFWKHLFQKCGVKLAMTTAYHPSADGQAERTNQTVETALRCLLVGKYEQLWADYLAQVEYSLNTSISDSTGSCPFEILYGVPHRETPAVQPPHGPKDAEDFYSRRQQIRSEVQDAIKFAQTRMSSYFDAKHRPVTLEGQAYIKMAKTGRIGYHLPQASALSTKKVGPFKILSRVGRLAYRLELPKTMKIHPVISVVHLEQASIDPFERVVPQPGPVIVEGQEEWVIEKLIAREKRGRKDGYKVKWKGWDSPTWEPADTLRQDVPHLVEKFEKARPVR